MPDPLPTECLSCGNGRAVAAKRIEHGGTFATTGLDNASEQGLWFLRGVTDHKQCEYSMAPMRERRSRQVQMGAMPFGI